MGPGPKKEKGKKKKNSTTEPGEALGSSPRQPAFLRCLRILERADRAYVTATRGAQPARIKGGLCALGQTASESAPEQHSCPPRLFGKDLGRRTPAARSPPRPLASLPLGPLHCTAPAAPTHTGVLASLLPRLPGLLLRATMSSRTARTIAVAVTLLHLARLVSSFATASASALPVASPFPRLPTAAKKLN